MNWVYRILVVLLFSKSFEAHCLSVSSLATHEKKEPLVRLMEDLFIEGKNYIVLNENFDLNSPNATLERYEFSNLESSLIRRGEVLNWDPLAPTDQIVWRILIPGISASNVFVWKLEFFTEKEMKIIALIRKYNMKAFIVLILGTEVSLETIKGYILKLNIFDIYVLFPTSNQHTYLMYEMCAYCNSGSHSMELDNSWKFGRGFIKPLKYKKSFKGNFFGSSLNIGFLVLPPGFFPIGMSNDGTPLWAGQEYLLLKTLAAALRFRPSMVEPEDKKGCLEYKVVKKSTELYFEFAIVGYCKLLSNQSVEMAGFPIAVDDINNVIFEPTAVYYQLNAALISARPVAARKGMSPSDVLDLSITLLVVACVIVVSLTTWLINRFGLQRANVSFSDCFLDTFAIFSLEPVVLRDRSPPNFMIHGVWILLCFIIISIVFGGLTSKRAVPKDDSFLINTLDDMKIKDYSWIRNPSHDFGALLKEKLPQQFERSKAMETSEALRYLLNNPSDKYVLLTFREAAMPLIRFEFWDGKDENPFHFSPRMQGQYPYMLTILLRKGSPFREEVTQKMLDIEAAGLFRGKFIPMTNDMLTSLSKIKKSDEVQRQDVTFTLNDFIPSILFLCMMIAGGFLLFIGEIVWSRVWLLVQKSKHTKVNTF